jgi:Uma2 family endonuclease
MCATKRMMTAKELERLPDDGCRHELVNGELITLSPTGFDHGAVVVNLTVLLANHVRSRQLGAVVGAETGFKIASKPDTVRAPDIGFIRRDRLPAPGRPRTFWPGPPDLAVEVISPTDRMSEVDEKAAAWLSAGAAMVWVVNPESRTVTVHRTGRPARVLNENDALGGEDVVPDCAIPVADVFA